ncbi:MAG: type II toxin-antitoxin system VapC family toxin [Candidatus Aminicenantes bacterium]|nr:type II toxin-antitoxin system VapC family toxin [Candidatus Aminicenantes bacterium]
MIVADTNLIAYLFIQGDYSDLAVQTFQKDPDWAAPLLWRSEFRSVLLKCLRKKYFSVNTAHRIMTEAEHLLQGKEYTLVSADILNLAFTGGCSAYDAEFVALARDMGIPLVTADSKLLNIFPEITVSPEHFLHDM